MKKWIILIAVIFCVGIAGNALAAGVNSVNKRRSAVYVLPQASGGISLYDRMQLAMIYRIIPSSAGGYGHRRSTGMRMHVKGYCPRVQDD